METSPKITERDFYKEQLMKKIETATLRELRLTYIFLRGVMSGKEEQQA